MRYEINHVLEGIALTRDARQAALYQELGDKSQQLWDAKAKRDGGPRSLVEVLRVQATAAGLLQAVTQEDFNTIRDEITRLERALPSTYEVARLETALARLQGEYDELATLVDTKATRLEQFLRALQAGGETHVSQHSLKQSGFAVDKLTDVIVARMNAQVAGNG